MSTTTATTCSSSSSAEIVQQQLNWANEVLEGEDPSEIWKVGKAMKKLAELYESEADHETLANVYFVWGSALARLAAADDDATLAKAAVDKFENVADLTSKSEIGSTGIVLWASSQLIVAMEDHNMSLIQNAIELFEEAVQLETEDTFEIIFQFANALKDVAEYLEFLAGQSESSGTSNQLEMETIVAKGIALCNQLYDQNFPKVVADDDDNDCDGEDLSELCLLLAKFYALLKDQGKVCEYLFRATDICPMNFHTLVESNRYVVRNSSQTTIEDVRAKLKELETRLTAALAELKCDAADEDNSVLPIVLESLGQNLYQQIEYSVRHQTQENNQDDEATLVDRARSYLTQAHRLNPALGCYDLARLEACFSKKHMNVLAKDCKYWLECADAYGVLDERNFRSDLAFARFWRAKWFRELNGDDGPDQ